MALLIAKPPRAPPSSSRSPPPVPARPPRYSTDYSNLTETLSHPGYSPSRPPTSASSSSFTASYQTPPQSPQHNVVSSAKFYVEAELDLGDHVVPSKSVKLGHLRTVCVDRLPTGDFGFSLRKASSTLKVSSSDVQSR